MSEVSAWVFKPLFAAAEQAGHSPEELVEGLSISPSIVRSRYKRVPWDDFVVVGERVCAIIGGPDALEDLVAEFGVRPVSGIVRLFAGRLVNVRALYTLGAKWLGPSTFLCTRAFCEDLPDGRLRQTVEILPPYQDSELFFRTMRGILRTTPGMVGGPDAHVEMTIAPRKGIYTITLSERERRRWWAARPRASAVADALGELTAMQEELQLSLAETHARGRVLVAQAARLTTLHRLSRQLAERTDVRGVADSVVDLLREHFGFSAVRVSVSSRAGLAAEVVRAGGAPVGPASDSRELLASSGVVGRVELWSASADSGSNPADPDPLLDELVPWIAVALDNARSFEALNAQTARLETESNERRIAERRLEQAARMDALGRLAGGLAHDVNNVLTAIAGQAELAGASLPEDDPVRESLDEIAAVSERASGLTAQVLAFSRNQVLHPKRVDLSELIVRMAPMLRSLVRDDIDLVISPEPDASVVVADPGRLEQIVVNLVANARDAIRGGGRISVDSENVRYEATPEDTRPEIPHGLYVRLRVQDTGTGMDSQTQARAFEPFFTTKGLGEGTGLGLSTAYGTVRQMGGVVDIESEPGKGAVVSILLPRSEGEADAIDEATGVGDETFGTEAILLVEDDVAVRSVAQRILLSRGYQVLAARDGSEALEICRSEPGTIQLLLTDIVMPGLGGRELARQVLDLRHELQAVIFTSGYAAPDEAPEPLPKPQAFLRKPYSPKGLLDEVRRLLDADPPSA